MLLRLFGRNDMIHELRFSDQFCVAAHLAPHPITARFDFQSKRLPVNTFHSARKFSQRPTRHKLLSNLLRHGREGIEIHRWLRQLAHGPIPLHCIPVYGSFLWHQRANQSQVRDFRHRHQLSLFLIFLRLRPGLVDALGLFRPARRRSLLGLFCSALRRRSLCWSRFHFNLHFGLLFGLLTGLRAGRLGLIFDQVHDCCSLALTLIILLDQFHQLSKRVLEGWRHFLRIWRILFLFILVMVIEIRKLLSSDLAFGNSEGQEALQFGFT
mmetsp:Transcript_37416/g.80603  ORF Transcript_37416/g.80603 Transcript_37416/m.80603 type:complete len:268 (-) Transcript_37416:210-1013(-)